MIVYLAGPILGCTDGEANDWRTDAKELLDGCEFLDPMARDYRGREAECVKEIVEGDKVDIRKADLLLAYCDRPSAGTSMEILYAHSIGAPVVAVVPAGARVSPWVAYHSWLVAETLVEACLAVRRDAI